MLNDPSVIAVDSVLYGSYTFVLGEGEYGGPRQEGGGSVGVPAIGGLVDLWIKLDEVNIGTAIVLTKIYLPSCQVPEI